MHDASICSSVFLHVSLAVFLCVASVLQSQHGIVRCHTEQHGVNMFSACNVVTRYKHDTVRMIKESTPMYTEQDGANM